MSHFSSGLCGCCSDMPICCIGMEVGPCLVGDNYHRISGQDGCSTCCLYTLLSYCGLCAIVGCNVRKQVREKYGIQKEPCGDCCVHCFCAPCAICQEAREIKHRQQQNQFVTSPMPPMPVIEANRY
eukprot:TRINITY_DN32123_c0_g2_i1.p2 TRINITY_DN32123_c0_g2~~TRINITY_DN32123_c0_g2_i1.p2  ORF type:complete len:126 (-),score=1.86 TRINITY_DN32123_c0_g2_i1:538-915(-)